MSQHEVQPVGSALESREQQRAAYLEGERGNPLTTSPKGGRILSAMQMPFFQVLPPSGIAVLTTTGRKTGRKRRKCVRAIRRGNKVFVVSLRGRYGAWHMNLVASPCVELRMRGGRFRGIAREIRDPAEHAAAREAYCDTVTRFDRLEYLNHRKGWPTPEQIRALHTRWFSVGAPVVVDLEV
jgi:deazaflavin-dependent oxidoreductase (nitroreductase family)